MTTETIYVLVRDGELMRRGCDARETIATNIKESAEGLKFYVENDYGELGWVIEETTTADPRLVGKTIVFLNHYAGCLK